MVKSRLDDFYADSRERAAREGNHLIDDLTDAEFRAAAHHAWLNAFSCVNPTDEFLAEIGRGVLNALENSDLVGSLTGSPVHKHVILTFNKS